MKASESLSLHIILKVVGGDTGGMYLQPPLTAVSTVSLE